jgi:hypothetical protein
MSKPTVDEMVEKVKKFGKVLRDEVARSRTVRVQEEVAIAEAIRIQSMQREKFLKEQKNEKIKDKKHHL